MTAKTDAEIADAIERGIDGSDYISFMLRDSDWRQIIAALRRSQSGEMAEVLRELAKRHEWQPGLGPCVCEWHERARKLLTAAEASKGDK